MKIEKEIFDLIMAELEGDLSPEEQSRLSAWVNDSSVNLEQYNQVINLYNKSVEIEVYQAINKQRAWERFNNSISDGVKKRSYWIQYSSAAVVLMVVGLSLMFVYQASKESTNGEQLALKEVYIKRNGGQIIRIDSIEEKDVVKIGGAHLQKVSGQLEYIADADGSFTSELNTLMVPKGKVFKLVLADSSVVWVNSDTRLTYPAAFTESKRRIWLESGEVFVKAFHDSKHPFVVNSRGLDVEVLGTEFNVKAYEADNNAQVTLKEGSVRVSASDLEKVMLAPVLLVPGQQLDVNYLHQNARLKRVDVELQTAWLQGEYYFDSTTLEEILKTLSRMYDYDVVFEDQQIKEKRYSGRLKRYDNIEDILNALRQFRGLNFKIENHEIIVNQVEERL